MLTIKTYKRKCHSILKQEDNSLWEENKSLRTAIRLTNNEFQNPNEEKCSQSTFSQNLHDQISDGVNDVTTTCKGILLGYCYQ